MDIGTLKFKNYFSFSSGAARMQINLIDLGPLDSVKVFCLFIPIKLVD